MTTTDGDDPFESYFRDAAGRPTAPRSNTPRPPATPPPYGPPTSYGAGGPQSGFQSNAGGWEPPEQTATSRRPAAGGRRGGNLPPELDPRGGGAGGGARRAATASPSGAGASVTRRSMTTLGAVLSVVVLIVTAYAWYVGSKFNPQVLHGLSANQVGQSSDDGAQNFLVMGSDSRAGLTQAQEDALHTGGVASQCNCTDAMLLVHVSPTRSGATIVSIPRDTFVQQFPSYVDDKGASHPAQPGGKINSAFTLGGPLLSVKTVETLTNVKIDHFMVLNFDAVVTLVNDVGGVSVCTPVPMHDQNSGLNLPAGTTHLDGNQALEYVRSRDIDGTGDIGREKRQQMFLVQLLHQTESTSITNVPNVIGQVSSSLTVDDQLSKDDMIGLATRLQGMSTGSVNTITVPVSNENYQPPGFNIGDTVQWNGPAATTLFNEVAQDVNPATGQSMTTTATPASSSAPPPPLPSSAPPAGAGAAPAAPPAIVPVQPSNVSVQVSNDSGITGQASTASTALANLGFAIAGPATAGSTPGQAATIIKYDPNYNESAATVQAAIPGSTLQAVPGLGHVIEVGIGTSYHGTVPSLRVVNTFAPASNPTAIPGSQSGPINQINVTNGNTAICPSK